MARGVRGEHGARVRVGAGAIVVRDGGLAVSNAPSSGTSTVASE